MTGRAFRSPVEGESGPIRPCPRGVSLEEGLYLIRRAIIGMFGLRKFRRLITCFRCLEPDSYELLIYFLSNTVVIFILYFKVIFVLQYYLNETEIKNV